MDSDGGALCGLGTRAQPDNFIENALRDFAFAHARKSKVTAVAREKGDDVGVVVEAGAFRGDVIGYDEVGVLGGQLLSRVFGDMIRFGGETDQEPRWREYRASVREKA